MKTTNSPNRAQHARELTTGLTAEHRSALSTRISAVLAALDPDDHTPDPGLSHADDLEADLERLAAALDPADRSRVWLVVAALSLRLPTERQVVAAARRGVLDGPRATIDAALRLLDRHNPPDDLRIARDEIVVDVHNTAKTDFFTGIQRVARECALRWVRDHGTTLLAWTPDLACPVDLDSRSREGLLADVHDPERTTADAEPVRAVRVIPWHSVYLVPELAAERPRTERLLAMARLTSTSVNVIGFDLVPLTSSETAIAGLPAEFAGYLAAARHFRRISTISQAAAQEYTGWRGMLSGAGFAGPEIHCVDLAAEVSEPTAADLARTRDRLMVGDLPMVLCVGSHEPRKNHLAVLHAAELLWRRGLQFGLTFIGGNSWNSEQFHAQVAQLQNANRPVETLSGVDDAMLWAAYRLARFTVFPSLNEGFGLPVAESLASGTPVITSRFGSMAEIAESGGAILIDPHDDLELADAMERLLTDGDLRTRLAVEATSRRVRTWDDYADEVWDYLVDGSQRI